VLIYLQKKPSSIPLIHSMSELPTVLSSIKSKVISTFNKKIGRNKPHPALCGLSPGYLDDEPGKEKSTSDLLKLFPSRPRTDRSCR
jgi:hypothetical protein